MQRILFCLFLVFGATSLWAQATPLPGDGVFAQITTTRGVILVQLEFQKAPLTVSNFVGLAEGDLNLRDPGQPYFDGLAFHRVEKGFLIQGGDPAGDGSGGPGYAFANEIIPGLDHNTPGVIAMANAGAEYPDSNGSQFYITLAPLSELNGNYSVFGHVVTGLDIAGTIQVGDRMLKVKILRQGAAAKAFQPTFDSFSQLDQSVREQRKQAKAAQEQQAKDNFKALLAASTRSESGLYYQVLQPGTGKKPQAGQRISAHYEGKLVNGTVFDSSYQRQQPLQFVVGRGQVIKGWDEGLLAMQVGEKRLLVIPPELGYGAQGAGNGTIPANSWLIFTVELVGILE